MSIIRSYSRRSLQNVIGFPNSQLLHPPPPELSETSESSLPDTSRNYNCSTRITNREASYGSLLSILSENSSQTFSSCSFDEDPESCSSDLSAMIERVDDVIYDGKVPDNMSMKLKEDCLTWTKLFPHFRLKGTSVHLHPYDELTDGKISDVTDILDGVNVLGITETIAEHHDNEESIKSEVPIEETEEYLQAIHRIKEQVIAKLVDHLVNSYWEWQEATAVETSKPLRIRTATASRNLERLRPRTAQESHRTTLPPVISTPLRPLEGILVVSSKVLQNRKTLNYLSRPGSSVTRLKPVDPGPSKLHLLKEYLPEACHVLVDSEEEKLGLRKLNVTNGRQASFPAYQATMESTQHASQQLQWDVSRELRTSDRPFSLPPVFATSTKEMTKVTFFKH